jgi:hypothetical protein
VSKSKARVDRAHVGPTKEQAAVGVNIFGAQAAPAATHPSSSGHRSGSVILKLGPSRTSGHRRPGESSSRHGGGADKPLLRPIIIVPEGMMALVNIYNAPKLLGVCH